MSPPPFRKVTDTLSQDTVQCLEQLLTLARDERRLVGIVFAAQLEGREQERSSRLPLTVTPEIQPCQS